MKISKFLIFAIISVSLGIMRVHLKVESIKLGYYNHKKYRYLQELLDENAILVYNLDKLNSARNLLAKKDLNFEFPKRENMLRLASKKINTPNIIEESSKRVTLFKPWAKFFEFLAQRAEAQDIK